MYRVGHGIPDWRFRRASQQSGFAGLARRRRHAGRFRRLFHTRSRLFYELAVDAGRSRGRYDDSRPAIDLFRRQGSVWRRQTDYPRPGLQQPSAFPGALELAQGARLSPGDCGPVHECGRPIGYGVDARRYPTDRQEGGAGSCRPGVELASAMAEAHKEWVSDIVVLNASPHPDMPLGIRSHFISSGWSLLLAMATLPQVLRNIQIELIETSESP